MDRHMFAGLVADARDAVLAACNCDTINPSDVAGELYKRLPAKNRAGLLRLLLPAAVLHELNKAPTPISPATASSGSSSVSGTDPDPTSSRSTSTRATSGPGPSKRSAYVYFNRTVWAPEFGKGNHATLGSCTIEMIEQIAAYRAHQAAQVEDVAKRFLTLADVMRAEHRTRVDELDEAKVRDILNGAVR